MSGIGIIANPHSKLNKRNPKRQELLGYILGEKGQLKVTGNISELADVAREFRERKIDILAINGGDGTVSRTITAFYNEYGSQPLPSIALLRGGTMNAVASNLGIRGSPESVLYRLVESFSSSKDLSLERVNTLKIKGLLGFIFADGTAPAFLRSFYAKKTGPLGAACLIAKIAWYGLRNDPKYFELVPSEQRRLSGSLMGEEIHISCSVMASTIPRMPMGAKLFPDAWNFKNGFQVLSFKDRPRDLIWKLPWYVVKRWKDSKLFRSLEVCMEIDRQGTSSAYTLDGELFESQGAIVIEQGPAIDFVRI